MIPLLWCLGLLAVGSRGLVAPPRSPSARLVPPRALPKDELIRIAKDYVENPRPEMWAEDYVFRGPVVGPLTKKDLLKTLEGTAQDISTAFPDMQANAFGFTADDPIEPNRVWYLVRPRATFTGPFNHPTAGLIEPTGAKYVAPPEARSMVINDEGKIKHQSVGYVVDRFTGDTTGGRGAVMGLFAVMGQDTPATVGSPLLQLLQKVASLLPEGTVPQSYSRPEDIPAWWTDKRMGAEA
mmetsp:Transcript_26458/g.79353  ORF Transcript_26458/g.79353 Transcript_26458/m.79353 type:complete len:239 (+) Transcript_26458:189-905(+)